MDFSALTGLAHSGSARGELCILTNVYYKYVGLARLTHELIDAYWELRPRVFFCGVTREEAPDLPLFPLALHRNDFMAILHDATGRLMQLGYKQCYLILDEQMPLGPCHSRHLNETIPALMDELQAGYIGLWGWDQKRHPARGQILDKAHYQMQNLPVDYEAKFSLHPALWRLDVLHGLLAYLLQTPGLAAHSPWQFEHKGGRADTDIPLSWKSSCYRIKGSAMALEPPGRTAGWLAPPARLFYDKVRALQYHFPNAAVRKWLWDVGGFDDIFFNGPYPMFFGGAMSKGVVNRHLVRFLKRRKKDELLARIMAAAPKS